jgi:hypothetical protein
MGTLVDEWGANDEDIVTVDEEVGVAVKRLAQIE